MPSNSFIISEECYMILEQISIEETFKIIFPLLQVERAEDVGGGASGSGERARRPKPVRARAAAVHADARGELLLGRGRAARLRRLRRHGLRGDHAFGRGTGEPEPEGELCRQRASTSSSLMISHQHADNVLCAVTANDGGQKHSSHFFFFSFSVFFFLLILLFFGDFFFSRSVTCYIVKIHKEHE